jgi:hypothetical protein
MESLLSFAYNGVGCCMLSGAMHVICNCLHTRTRTWDHRTRDHTNTCPTKRCLLWYTPYLTVMYEPTCGRCGCVSNMTSRLAKSHMERLLTFTWVFTHALFLVCFCSYRSVHHAMKAERRIVWSPDMPTFSIWYCCPTCMFLKTTVGSVGSVFLH